MQYHSTRGNSPAVGSAQAILTGIAPDGGLYLPKVFPTFAWEKCVAATPLDSACQILSAFFPDIPNMAELVRRAYENKFASAFR